MDVYLNASGQVKDIRQHRLDQAATLGRYNLRGLYFRVHTLGVDNFMFNSPPGGGGFSFELLPFELWYV